MKTKIILLIIFCILIIIIPFTSIKNPGNFFGKNSSISSPSSSIIKSTGEFKILNETSGEVITVGDKDYVYGCVAAEMPADYPDEALKAQAVASYTYASMLREREKKTPTAELKGAYFTADPTNYNVYITKEIAKQRFGDKFDAYWNKITSAVDSVFGTVATYNGSLITASYFSLSSGKTEYSKNVWGGDLAYLVPVISSWDTSAPGYSSTVVLSEADVKSVLSNSLSITVFPDEKNSWFTDFQLSESGNVLTLKVCGTDSTGIAIRKAFSLRSANFTVTYANSQFTFSVVGYGHDVGMSQYGARSMALEGKTWDQILKYYYTGVELVDIKTLNLQN